MMLYNKLPVDRIKISIINPMLVPDLKLEIRSLEKRLAHFENLLELSIKNNDAQTRTNVILQEINKLYEKLDELKRVSMLDNLTVDQ